MNLAPEKRQRIIDACMNEFAVHGYREASTNAMTRAAGISKGLLFHYFGSKKELFLDLIDLTAEEALLEIEARAGNLSGDLFDRLMEYGMIKLELGRKNPAFYHFLFKAFVEVDAEVMAEIQKRLQQLAMLGVDMLRKNLDWGKFRQDIDREKAFNLVVMALQGLQDQYTAKLKELPDAGYDLMPEIAAELNEYVRILKVGVYEPKEPGTILNPES
jgi:AcrR family transcriptional regulator